MNWTKTYRLQPAYFLSGNGEFNRPVTQYLCGNRFFPVQNVWESGHAVLIHGSKSIAG